ncbi:MAG: phage Gp37/Gp68 family protein [Chloroflexota bacterium]|nr:phage Gp37/Gp68 family protein [Chloroflexota bacterium]
MPSNIEWTDETWNPVTGCTRVSPGCDHCYMYALYPRLNAMGVSGYDTEPSTVRLLPERLNAPLRWGAPRHVFVNSMSDLFHHDVPFEFVTAAFEVMQEAAESRGHVFQVLTKRPGRAVAWWEDNKSVFNDEWPANVWIGTSVENQKYAPRITVLSRLPAPIRFVSAEPLLGQVDLSPWLSNGDVQWLIVGGESGRSARPMDMEWVRSLRDQSQEAGVAFFLKQLGGARNKRGGAAAVVDGETWREMPDRSLASV